MLGYAMPRHAMLCYVMLCYAMLCYAMLFHAMLCYAMLRLRWMPRIFSRVRSSTPHTLPAFFGLAATIFETWNALHSIAYHCIA